MTSKTIFLTGNELAVTGLSGANAHIRNDSKSVVYAAKMPGVSAGADEVTPIPAGQSVSVRGIIGGAVCLLGTVREMADKRERKRDRFVGGKVLRHKTDWRNWSRGCAS